MARPIRNIEIYLPLDFNDGRPIPESKYVSLLAGVVEPFRRCNIGPAALSAARRLAIWPDIYHDRVVVFSVMDFREETQLECLRYLARLKSRLKKKLEQLEVLITVTELLAI